MHVVLSTDAVVDIFAVMIELLNTSVASLAVIAVFMYIDFTAIAPY